MCFTTNPCTLNFYLSLFNELHTSLVIVLAKKLFCSRKIWLAGWMDSSLLISCSLVHSFVSCSALTVSHSTEKDVLFLELNFCCLVKTSFSSSSSSSSSLCNVCQSTQLISHCLVLSCLSQNCQGDKNLLATKLRGHFLNSCKSVPTTFELALKSLFFLLEIKIFFVKVQTLY